MIHEHEGPRDSPSPAMTVQVRGKKPGGTVGITAPTLSVRVRPRIPRLPEPGARGRIAVRGGPESRLEARMRWSGAGASARSDGIIRFGRGPSRAVGEWQRPGKAGS